MLFTMHSRHILVSYIAAVGVALMLGGCRQSSSGAIPPGSESDDKQIVAVQAAHRDHVEVTGRVRVYKLLSEDDKGLRHERFLVMLSNGTTVLVAHSIDKAPPVPVEEGDALVLHGEFVSNERGGVIHWTHHSDSPRHEGGWILYKGQKYE